MKGKKWLKTFFLVIIHFNIVVGGDDKTSVPPVALASRAIPCFFEGNSDKKINGHHIDTTNVTTYELSISSPWMIHKGCFFKIQDTENKMQKELDHNSPGRCALFCESNEYFGLHDQTCVCLEKQDFKMPGQKTSCTTPCPDNSVTASCGTKENSYYDVYFQRLDFNQKPVDQDNVDKNCILAKANGEVVLKYKAVSCGDWNTNYCYGDIGGKTNVGNKSKSNDKIISPPGCSWYRHKLQQHESSSNWFWTTTKRFKVIWQVEKLKYELSYNLTCQLERSHNWTTAQLSLKSAVKSSQFITLLCSLKTLLECSVLKSKDIHVAKTEKEAHDSNIPLSTAAEYLFSALETSTKGQMTYSTMTSELESHGLSTNEELTSVYNLNATETSFSSENYVFALQIGIAISVSCLVIVVATVAFCMYRPKRSEENIVMATEGPLQHTISTAALAENYSEPKDKASSSSEINGPRFCATTPCQETNYQKTENGEYHHLDFTLRSETAKRFADTSEYDHVRGNVVSVFDQPWDTATSKVNKLFSQISKSVVQKGQNVRKSLIKRRVSRSGSPKFKNRASDYCEAWKTHLNNQQFVLDSDVDNQSYISIDVANSTVDSKDKPELRRTDSAFPVLPYSERINVKSTHIYDEQDDRRMSLRERLLHMISIRPLKMPFGIELDLRASRSKSKIYSLATSIEEIDESVA